MHDKRGLPVTSSKPIKRSNRDSVHRLRAAFGVRVVALYLNAALVVPLTFTCFLLDVTLDIAPKNAWIVPSLTFSGLMNFLACSLHRRSMLLTGLRTVALVSNASFIVAGGLLWLTGEITEYYLFILSLCLFGLAALNSIAIFATRTWHMQDNPICPECGFDLRGVPSRGCPECGWRRHERRSN